MAPLCAIYGLYSTEDETVRYIGQTTQKPESRLTQHLAEALRPPGTSRCHRWIRKVLRSGHRIGIIVLERDCLWDIAERKWIAEYRCKYPDLMTNLSDGGCGYNGKRSEETRRRMSKPKSAEHRKKLLGLRRSNETRRRMSIAQMANTKGAGEKNGSAVLCENDVIQIKRKLQENVPLPALAREYGVSKAAVSKIKTGRTWKHLSL